MGGSQWLKSQVRHSYVATFSKLHSDITYCNVSPKAQDRHALILSGVPQSCYDEALPLYSLGNYHPTQLPQDEVTTSHSTCGWCLGATVALIDLGIGGLRASLVHFARRKGGLTSVRFCVPGVAAL